MNDVAETVELDNSADVGRSGLLTGYVVKFERLIMKNVELCTAPTCRTFTRQINHDYCSGCRRIAADIATRFKHVEDGRRPTLESALGIAWNALRIFHSPYSSPEQVEWAVNAYPEGMADIVTDAINW